VNPKIKPILDELREALATHYDERLAKLVLFGSQARGDAEADSDIDVLVVLRGEVTRQDDGDVVLEKIADICLEHDVVIQWIVVPENRYRGNGDSLMRNVHRDGIAI
jgi:predicted nucleotidyltransferase